MQSDKLIANYIKSRKESLEKRGKFVDLDFLSNISLNHLVPELLILEYGYLLSHLSNLEWEILEIPLSSLKVNEKYMSSGVSDEIISTYQKLSLKEEIIGTVKKYADGTFFLIDGYHRVSSAKRNKQETILVFSTKLKT